MQTSDILTRISGLVMVCSALWNGIIALLLFLTMIWVCVGIWWVVPLVLSVVQLCLGVAMIALGDKVRPLAFSPIFGIVVTLANFNFFNLFLDLIAVGLGVGGFVTYEEQDDDDF
jgi:hypothetical protein